MRLSLHLCCCSLLMAAGSSSGGALDDSDSCREVADDLTWRLRPQLDEETAVLTADVSVLRRRLGEGPCGHGEDLNLRLELWRRAEVADRRQALPPTWDREEVKRFRCAELMISSIEVLYSKI